MDGTAAIWQAVNGGAPILVILFATFDARESLLALVESLAPPEQQTRRVIEIAPVFDEPSTLLLLSPEDEASAILELEGRREALLARTAPAVVFLLRDGAGMRALSNAPALSSWLQGHVYDPDERDLGPAERAREEFVAATGADPVEWLARWRSGKLPDTRENNLFAGRALAIVQREPRQ